MRKDGVGTTATVLFIPVSAEGSLVPALVGGSHFRHC